MRIGLTSDVHLEFGDWYPVNPEGGDVLLLAGDIMVASDLHGTHRTERFTEFLVNAKKEWPEVIYIMGNHEHYHGDFAESAKLLREVCEPLGIHFLDKECVTIKGVTFIGGTLWTNMNNRDETTLRTVRDMMNDFRTVRNSNRVMYRNVPVYELDENGCQIQIDMNKKAEFAKFSPEDAADDHDKFVSYVRTVTEGRPNDRFVVVGHHAPSRRSTHPRYVHDVIMNGAYSSNLEDFITDRPQIEVWVHGHTHELFDYMVGETRVVCNPRGYVHHERPSNDIEPYFARIIELSDLTA